MAIVMGVNQLLDPYTGVAFAKAGMLLETRHCYTWDASSDGYLHGKGCGAIVLKAFNEQSSRNVYAHIIGTIFMADGNSASITAPIGLAQERVIRQTLKVSGMQAEDVDYIEGHGTGTVLGDPIEIEAIAGVFATSRKRSIRSHSLVVGSVKSDIGHLEMAAGMAGLIKAILVVGQQIAPSKVCLNRHGTCNACCSYLTNTMAYKNGWIYSVFLKGPFQTTFQGHHYQPRDM